MSDFQHAQLDWDENGQPLSRAFGDVYFSRHSGLNETRHVFLATNRLAERFAALGDGEVLCIGETGFGTGLNFLCAWQLFERVAPAGARLEFVSVEKFPLAAADLRRALALWPELAPWSEALLGQYLAVHPGFQRLAFAGGRVGLTLLLGDALECLPQLDARVDAWFLDGFAPAKNPDMWSPVLFAELARLSAPQATLGTFTSAGFVRRGLVEAGFAMQRVPGYGQKREMLSGTYQGPPANAGKPWYARPAPHAGRRAALVVGGGLAGCASAASLAARGWQVTLIERHPGLAREASGNPQGVLYLKLSAHGTPLSRLVLSGFGHTRRLLERLRRGDEFQYSDLIAERYHTRHHRLRIGEHEVIEQLPAAFRAMSEPMVSHDCIAFYLLAREVSKHCKVVQSGQGADELFAGYHWYPKVDGADDAFAAYRAAFFDRDHEEYLATVGERFRVEDVAGRFVRDHFASPGAEAAVDKALRLDSTIMLVDDPVKRVDNMTMAWGLEARVPFLDYRLAELSARIPARFKLGDGGKQVLKGAARKVIPSEVIDRPKGYFPVPGLKHLQGRTREWVRELLLDPSQDRGLFQPAIFDRLLSDPDGDLTPLRGSKLWQLAALNLWLSEQGL
ncbi:TPA: bifunctional tRNA (5-methylaminomethyl-2-thiouridine)(34)-methyltransferase MnmD/FAD-dependent 5-carboxymethylaminomethyl-2-thiouridine(34) oxidoreductase MnmC [Pseudomonas aeruginosa]